jgi:transcriptional regulator with XRE-family HTH domain
MSLMSDVRATRRLPSPAVARMIRESAGVSQSRLAEEVGVHRVTLSRWECGHALPRGTARAKYAQIIAELQQELAA